MNDANDQSFSPEAGLFSYSQILHLLRIEFSRARRYSYPLTCALLQVDRLDNLKDLYGFKVGELIEERVVRTIHHLSRASDFLGKMGERMVLILPHTDAEGVRIMMDRVRESLRDYAVELDGKPVQVTISAGIATYKQRNSLFFDSVLKNAEAAMTEAVRRGGNLVEVHEEPPDDGSGQSSSERSTGSAAGSAEANPS